MALQEVTAALLRRCQPSKSRISCSAIGYSRRYATDAPRVDVDDLETSDFLSKTTTASEPALAKFDPIGRTKRRNRQLPPSRYQPRPPRYYRGPLHPVQPPKPSDPSSREFIAGPFSLPRLEQTYHDTIASDYMTLTYEHFPPGHTHHQKGDRLRPWIGDSPYFKNRPLRGPRGHAVLPLLRKPITFNNVPKITGVSVHSMVKGAIEGGSAHLHVAGMALQAMTNVRPIPHDIRKPYAPFSLRKGQTLSLTCELLGEDAYHFLSKVVDVVLPKIKDYKGVKGSSGDGSGCIAFGFTPEQVALFPEIEVNFDAYPERMIPGCHVIIKTSAKNDEQARMLLMQMGFPFYGRTERETFVEKNQWKPIKQAKGYYAIADS